MAMIPNFPKPTLRPSIQPLACRLNGGFQVGARMNRFEDLEKVLKIMGERSFQMRNKARVRANRSFETLQALARHSALLKRLIKTFEVAIASEKLEVRFTDDDVVGSSVVVEFLVPFLHEMAA